MRKLVNALDQETSEKFTPGAWTFNPHTERFHTVRGHLVSGDGDSAVAIVARSAFPQQAAEHEANAHLIAAAPDLYETLQDCLQFIEANVRFVQPNPESGEEPADRFSYEAQPICSAAQAALKKARGGT